MHAAKRSSAGAEAGLVRAIGIGALTAAVINIIIGGGVFLLPATLFGNLGAAAPTAFLAGAFAIVPIALCFAAAGSRVTATGGPYTYAGAAFGPFAGFVAGALMWITNIASSAGIANGLLSQLAKAWTALMPAAFAGITGLDPAAGGSWRVLVLVVVYAVLIALNAFGVKLGARAIVVLATLKLTPLFVLAALGLFFVDWARIDFLAVGSFAALGTSMVAVMFAYSGMETALIPSGEVKNPSRDVPRATLAAIAIVVLLYCAIQIVSQGVLGEQLRGNTAPLAATAGALWEPGYALLIATASVSMFGFLMGNLLASSRMVYAFGRDGYLPAPVGALTARHHVPLVAVLLHGVLALCLALVGSFDWLILVSGGANCLVYVAVCLAAWRLQREARAEHGDPFVLPGGGLIPLLSVAAMIAILATLTRAEWTAIGAALAALVAIYFVLERLRRH
jgi:amino acid transporter